MGVISFRACAARPDFADLVLRGLAAMGSPDPAEGELCLDLGLSLWVNESQESLVEARASMMAVRSALVKASGMDLASEPVPLSGVEPRLDVLNLGAYLRSLLVRAAANAQCDVAHMADLAVEYLRGRVPSTTASALA
jgi:hypothetical protein